MADDTQQTVAVPAPQGVKPWWQSKTIVVNLALGLVMAILPVVPAAKPVADWINSNTQLIGALWSVANVVLRLITKDAIQLGD